MLCKHELFLNSRANFNDPFDSQPIIRDDLENSAIREYLSEMVRNPINSNRDPTHIIKLFELGLSGKARLSKRSIAKIKSGASNNAALFLDQGGLLSFSLAPEHPLLWGHYSASYGGICAVFQRSESLTSALSVCAKISYVEKRPELHLSLLFDLARNQRSGQPFDDLSDTIFFRSFLHKSHHWAYEEEARIFHPFKAMQKIRFERKELRAFLVGPNATLDLETRLRAEIKHANASVEVYRTALSKTDFRIIIPHNFLQSRPATRRISAA